jgi:hypothetical protein
MDEVNDDPWDISDEEARRRSEALSRLIQEQEREMAREAQRRKGGSR